MSSFKKEELPEENLPDGKTAESDGPPIFKSWNQLYGFVLILHAFIIFLFYQLTQAYS